MSDVAGIILSSILTSPDDKLEIWSKLKLQYFNTSHSDIYLAMAKYYNKFNKLPSFELLKLIVRDSSLNKKVKALELLEVSEDIDIDIAIEALIDQYTQDEILDNLYTYVDKLEQYDSSEAILKLSEISLHLEEVVSTAEEVYLMNDMFMMNEEELKNRLPLSLNNALDASTGGMELSHLVMVGGDIGSGKTVAVCNITTNQYLNGDVTLFFTIEMRAREINDRNMSILSGVSNRNIKNQECNEFELEQIAKVRRDFFTDSEEVFQDYLKNRDYQKFEKNLIKSKKLKPDNQIILIDSPGLTLSDIDLHIQKFKAKHGDKLKTVVVDYVNQIVVSDQYDWMSQMTLSKKLKDLAGKHNILVITPYQTDLTGVAKFSKSLLVPADITMNLMNKGDYINFKSTKTRGMPAFEFNAPVDWETLRISGEDALVEVESEVKAEGEGARDAVRH